MKTIIGTTTTVINNVRRGRNSIVIRGLSNASNMIIIKGYIATQMITAIFHFFGGFINN